jgi:putative endonuclease
MYLKWFYRKYNSQILTNKNHTVLSVGATKNLKKRIDKRISAAGAVLQKIYNATILFYYEEFDQYRCF